MNYDDLIEQVMQTAGLSSLQQAERALRATVSAVASCLSAQARTSWAHLLPSDLHLDLLDAPYQAAQTAQQVYARVPAGEGVPQPYAMEHAQSVIRELGQLLDEDTRTSLARELPDDLAALLREPQRATRPSRAHGHPRQPAGSTLATGRPGAVHPLSESEPHAGQSGSVADWDDARMEHTLGSGHEETGDPLANSKPGSKRGLSG
jgi:uncharacterized protein (DUF2267 family)